MSIYIGIDPGKSGAVTVLAEDRDFCLVFEKETHRDIIEFLAEWRDNAPCSAVLEQVNAMPGQGVTSMFTFGENFGWWQGVLESLRIPFELARPQKWQAGLGKPQKLKGKELKKWLQERAQRKFPNTKITAKMADAYLLADYCRKIHHGL